VAGELGWEVTRAVRVSSWPTNAVYEVEADGRRLVLKASTMHAALRAEAWACARGADTGCAAPVIHALGRLGTEPDMSAFVMSHLEGQPIAPGSAAFRELGAGLRRLHDVRLTGFGWLAEAARDERGDPSPVHGSWLGFLNGIVGDARGLAQTHPIAVAVADAAMETIDEHAAALAAVEVGSLCHGDLKPAHVLTNENRLAGVIDWGDAIVADPLWDIARLAQRVDAGSVSRLLEGYAPDLALSGQIEWRIPLYEMLWMLVDAIGAHRLGHRADAPLAAALACSSPRAR
jgi:aminoglycoside phosphotransferase (APT) family kinase protein